MSFDIKFFGCFSLSLLLPLSLFPSLDYIRFGFDHERNCFRETSGITSRWLVAVVSACVIVILLRFSSANTRTMKNIRFSLLRSLVCCVLCRNFFFHLVRISFDSFVYSFARCLKFVVLVSEHIFRCFFVMLLVRRISSSFFSVSFLLLWYFCTLCFVLQHT